MAFSVFIIEAFYCQETLTNKKCFMKTKTKTKKQKRWRFPDTFFTLNFTTKKNLASCLGFQQTSLKWEKLD